MSEQLQDYLPLTASSTAESPLEAEIAEQILPFTAGEGAETTAPTSVGDNCADAVSSAPAIPIAIHHPSNGFIPPALQTTDTFEWDKDLPAAQRYQALGGRLKVVGDLYRRPDASGGLLLVTGQPNSPTRVITTGRQLAPVIADRLNIRVVKDGNDKGTILPVSELTTMLGCESFLQQFDPIDAVLSLPCYRTDFTLTQPGYTDAGPGQRYLYQGPQAQVERSTDAFRRFLDVMEFATEADRTNALAAALTVLLRNHWAGAKPLVLVTSTKSHGGKDTIVAFAAGRTGKVSVDYQAADWAFQQGLLSALKACPEAGVINVENARLSRGETAFASATLERVLTDPEPVLHSSQVREALPLKNHLVMALTTNFGSVNEDLMNRALPIHLAPVGDVAARVSPIDNPKLVYLPANCDLIEAELRGLIETWKEKGRPLDTTVQHPFTDWARTIGGILMVNDFTDFLANYGLHRTVDDPVRRALGLLAAAKPDEWLTADSWAKEAVNLGLVKPLVSEADRSNDTGRARGLGVVLSKHDKETFRVETDDEVLTVQLEKKRVRFEKSGPSTRYCFTVLNRAQLPEDQVDDPQEAADEPVIG